MSHLVSQVDLAKDSHGLGITIAGYIGGDNSPDEISGIFVKSIGEGSAAGLDGRVKVNDQIIEVGVAGCVDVCLLVLLSVCTTACLSRSMT